MLRAEVQDVGGCGVGTSTKAAPNMLAAMRFIAQTSKERWAGPWRIVHVGTGITILEGST